MAPLVSQLACRPKFPIVSMTAPILELSDHLLNRRQGLVWQDTTLSLTYDRPCASLNGGHFTRMAYYSGESDLSFVDCCHGQATVLNDLSHDVATVATTSRTLPPATFQVAEQQIMLYRASTSEHLRRRSVCHDDEQRRQHDTLEIYTNYFVVQIRRRRQMSCSGQNSPSDDQTSKELDPEVVKCCQLVLKAYCRLREIAPRASRLWLIVHATLSCALLVARQAEIGKDRICSTLVQQLRGPNGSSLSLLSHPLLTSSLEELREFAEDRHLAGWRSNSTNGVTCPSEVLYG